MSALISTRRWLAPAPLIARLLEACIIGGGHDDADSGIFSDSEPPVRNFPLARRLLADRLVVARAVPVRADFLRLPSYACCHHPNRHFHHQHASTHLDASRLRAQTIATLSFYYLPDLHGELSVLTAVVVAKLPPGSRCDDCPKVRPRLPPAQRT